MFPNHFGKMTLNELKIELDKVGAPKFGRKKDLVARLIAWHNNNNFRGVNVNLPENLPIPDWPSEGFKTLTLHSKGILPPIGDQHIHQYVVTRQCQDREPCHDFAAFRRGSKMEMALRSISHSIRANEHFFSGIVKAEFKSVVQYNIKFMLNNRGEIQYSHCECPAGKGPHGTCKHVVAAFQFVAKFVSSGELDLDKSCTEILQRFYEPKKVHKGSPLKIVNIHQTKKEETPIIDPRYRNHRNQLVNWYNMCNKTVAFSLATGLDVANRYSFGKADMAAAMNDHDYPRTTVLQDEFQSSVYDVINPPCVGSSLIRH